MPTYLVRAADYPPERSWQLLDWCARRGAAEFGLGLLGPPYLAGTPWARLDALLASFRRRVASAGDRWLLTGESMAVLRDVLPGGPFAQPSGAPSIEEFTVYRGAETLLRFDHRRGEGILELRDDDAASLARSPLPAHPLAR